jgi:hypothetical protein
MSAYDAVDGARSAVSKCYGSCVESESHQGGETTANLGAEALNELDDDKNSFDGAKTYKVTLPPNIPAAAFWSFTFYDN